MCNKLFWIYIAVLVFSPLAFGTVEQWSLTIMEVLLLFALLLLLLQTGKETAPLYRIPGIVPLLCLWAYCIVQAVPMPPSIVKFLSPEAYNIHMGSVGVFDPDSWISLSVQKKSTIMEFFRLGSYTAVYVLTVQLLSRKELLKKTVTILIAFSALLAFASILKYLLGDPEIFWIRQVSPEVPVPFGPFINKNHYAGLMGMLLPLVLSVFLGLKPRTRYDSFRDQLAELLSRRGTNMYILVGLAAIIIIISIFLSRSRGGIISVSLSTLILGIILYFKSKKTAKNFSLIVVPVSFIVLAAWIGWDSVLKRFVESSGGNWHIKIDYVRVEVWRDAVSYIRDFLLTGTGFGTFVSAYPKYRSVLTDWTIEHAHNDYLEFLAEGGIIGFLLIACFLASVIYKSYRSFKKRKDSYSIYLYVGCLAGMLSILFFSLTDFNLHIGSNGLYFFFLAGLAVSASSTRLHEGSSPTYLQPSPISKKPVLIITPALLALCIIFNAGLLAGEYYFAQIRDVKIDKMESGALQRMADIANSASLFDPFEARYHSASGNIEMRMSNQDSAIRSYEQATILDPLNSEYLQRLGLAISEKGDPEKGEKLIKSGVAFDIGNPSRYKFFTLYLFSKGRKEEAVNCMKQALRLSPDKSEDFIMMMMLRGMSDDEILASLPERTVPYLAFADYLAISGKDADAQEIYTKALSFITQERTIQKSYFDREYNYYIKKALYDEALKVMKQAIAAFPDDGELHYRTGALYEKLGLDSLALDEYKKAKNLDQSLVDAIKRIEAISSRSGRSTD